MVESARLVSGATITKMQHPIRGENGTTTAAISAADRSRKGDRPGGFETRGQVSPGVVQAVSATAVAPAAVVIGSSRANKALVGLRSELGRHLAAVAQVLDGGRHLQQATRVMREIEKLEALDQLQAEVSTLPT